MTDGLCEEVLELKYSMTGLYVFITGHTAHSRDMHLDHICNILQLERTKIWRAFFKEIGLTLQNRIHNSEHCVFALFDRFNKPRCAVELLAHVFLYITLGSASL